MGLKNFHICLLIGGGAVLAALPAHAVTYWASGSNYDEGWFDFGQSGSSGCGRATAASMIYWWQRESGLENPVHQTVDQICNVIENQFFVTDDPATGGTFIHTGVRWYMNTYYPDVNLDDIFWQSPNFWGNTDAQRTSDYIKSCLSEGLLIGLDSSSHAQTVWGAEFDDQTGMITRIWITDPGLDSEQNSLEELEISPFSSQGYPLSFIKKIWREDGTGYDSQSMGVRWLYTLTPLAAVPEPSAAFAVGAGMLFLACVRRRRSRGK